MILTYDRNGNLINRSDNISHIFDYNNRLTTITIPGSPPTPTKTLTYAYDSQGIRLASTIKSSGAISNPATTTYDLARYMNIDLKFKT